MSKQVRLRGQAFVVGMLLTLAVLAAGAGAMWSTSVGIDAGTEPISGPQIGPGDGGG